ncbi:MAG: kinase [Clostridia bacterium]|nr:kinase [Clostridia bacterium]
MAKLIVLRGNSGSGKTTISKALQKKFGRNTMLIAQDVIRMQMLNAKDIEALPLIIDLIKYGKQNSEITILEGILDSEFYRPLFEVIVEEYGVNVFAFYYDLPFEETLLRHNTKPNKADFGEEDMKRWWKEKDYINIIPERIITKEESLSDTVDMIYSLVLEESINENSVC